MHGVLTEQCAYSRVQKSRFSVKQLNISNHAFCFFSGTAFSGWRHRQPGWQCLLPSAVSLWAFDGKQAAVLCTWELLEGISPVTLLFVCLCFSFYFFIEFIGVTLLNKITEVSDIQFHNTSSVYCVFTTPSQASFHHHLSPLYPLLSLPNGPFHLVTPHLSEWPPSINQHTTSAGEDVGNGDPCALSMGMQAGAAAVEDSMEFPQKTNSPVTL